MRRLRIPATVLWRLSSGIFALVLLWAVTIQLAADTGTYRITNYIVTLEPQSDGQVRLTYQQDWRVLSGDIPWVTVGLPNANFSVASRGGAAASVRSDDSGGFSGVRVDLDKDYQPGETFTISFTVLQNNLLERLTADNKWRINLTPSWYDRAEIDHLEIRLVSPVDRQTYSSLRPEPTFFDNNTIVWQKTKLSPGQRFSINAESLDGSFLTAAGPLPVSTVPSGRGPAGVSVWWLLPFIAIGVIIVAALVVYFARRSIRPYKDVGQRVAEIEEEMALNNNKKRRLEKGFQKYVEKEGIEPDEEGRYYDASYGDYITPAIWAAVIAPQIISRSGSHVPPPPPSSGSTGCACACVSCACACACACAGGGAAGCSRKTLHDCEKCNRT